MRNGAKVMTKEIQTTKDDLHTNLSDLFSGAGGVAIATLVVSKKDELKETSEVSGAWSQHIRYSLYADIDSSIID